YAVADVISAIGLSLAAIRPTAGCTTAVDRHEFSLRRAAPVAASSLVGTLYYRVDVWLLSLLVGPAPVAVYASGYRICDGLLLPANAIATVSIPSTARLKPSQQRRRLLKLSLLVLAPRYGIAAAAWATVGCQALLAVLLARTLRIGRVAATSESTQSNEQNLDHAEHRGPGARDAGPGNDVRTVLPLLDGVHEGV